ncbi:MAG TPA: RNA 2'-phosphotransferase [Candidatus Eisenbacteria bacterium]|nr:RNA 2'-phosphotransferase [Candidatus Eisenbacteria bacterium]
MVPQEKISKFLTYVLRHRPHDVPLEFDERGFVAWAELRAAVQRRFPDATEEEILQVVQESDKRRFELKDGKARATYGHSFPVDLAAEPTLPPARLYHGTARDLAETIVRTGLKPRDRQFVHLSASLEDALAVGRRRDPLPAVVVVEARAAADEGLKFYASGPLFLTSEVPAKYLSLWRR